MNNYIRKSVSIVLSVALLLSTILIGGIFGVSAEDSNVFVFDFDTVKNFELNKDGSTDQNGKTFYPAVANTPANLSVTQQDIDVVIDAEGNTEKTSTLQLVATGSANLRYIPTDENGKPFIIEPNTVYDVNVEFFVKESGSNVRLVVGGGAFGAFNSSYSAASGKNNYWNTFIDYVGTDGTTQNLSGFYPLYRAYGNSGFTAKGEMANTDGAGRSYDKYNKYKSPWAHYYNLSGGFMTGDFSAQNSEFTKANNTGSYNCSFGQYFSITLLSGTTATVNIDSITITKVGSIANITFDPNGGSFDGETENAVTSREISGSAFTVAEPTHADSNMKFAGWSYNGNIVTSVTAEMDGAILYAVWNDTSSDTFTFNFDTVKNFVVNSGSSTDQNGNTFYPFHSNDSAASSAEQQTITAVVDANGTTEELTTLEIGSGGRFTYVPTDENGHPYIIEPNTVYDVNIKLFAKMQATASTRIYFGGGKFKAFKSGYNDNDGSWSSYSGTVGSEGEAQNNNGFIPLYIAREDGVTGDGAMAYSYAIKEEISQYDKTDKSRYYDIDCAFLSGDFESENGAFKIGTATFGEYFTIGTIGAAIYNIDSISITKRSVLVNFDANGGYFDGAEAVTTASAQQNVGKSFSTTVPTPTAEQSEAGLVFAGWSWYKNGKPVNTVTSGMNGKTLYAVWKTPVMVTFNANGGAFSDNSDTKTLTQYVGLDINCEQPVKGFDTFLGWSTDISATEPITDITVTDAMSGTTLYAVWKTDPHAGYSTFERFIDYSEYTVRDARDGTGNSWGPNDCAGGRTWFSVVDDSSATGGSYLKFKAPHDEVADAYPAAWLGNYGITMTPTGYYNSTGEGDENLYLPENTTYKVTLRVRTVELSGKNPTLYVAYGSYHSSMDSASKTDLITGMGEMKEWTEISAIFTTPSAYSNNKNLCFIGITNGGCNDASEKFEYHIDTVKLERVTATKLYSVAGGSSNLLDTMYGVPGTELVLPVNITRENYIDGTSNGYVTTYKTSGNWFADEACTDEPIMKFANTDIALYCDDVATVSSTIENQDGYCGFDTYREDVVGASYSTDSFAITDTDSYTGKKSLKTVRWLSDTASFEIRGSEDIWVLDGKTYKVSFAYKTDKDITASVGLAEAGTAANGITVLGTAELSVTNDWTTTSVTVTADFIGNSNKGYVFAMSLTDTTESAKVFIDNIVVSSVTESVGASTEDGDNLRFMMTYKGMADDGNTVIIEDEKYTVCERGILVKGAENTAELSLDTTAGGVIKISNKDALSENWGFNTVTGSTVYSVNIKGISDLETYNISARGYVVLSDGNTYYTDIITASLADIPEAGKLIPDGTDLESYYVYLPEGTTFASDKNYTLTFYNSFLSEVQNVLSNDVMQIGAYVKFTLNDGETAVNEVSILVPDELKYTVHSGSSAAEIMNGLDVTVATQSLDQVGQDAVNYIFITDIHYNDGTGADTSVVAQVELISKLASEDDSIDFVVIGGDTTSGMYQTKSEAVSRTQEILAPLKNCTKPVFVLMGNHDDNSYHDSGKSFDASKILSDKDWTDNIITYVNSDEVNSKLVHDTAHPDSKYYYYDLEKNGKSTRIVCLDALDYGADYDENGNITELPIRNSSATETNKKYWAGTSWWGYGAQQMKWLAEQALGTLDEGAEVIFLSHMGIDKDTNLYGTAVQNSTTLRAIIKAFQNGSTYNETVTDNVVGAQSVSISADFGSVCGQIMSYQFGHTHGEAVIYSGDIDLWQICSGTAHISQQSNGSTFNNKTHPWRVYTRGWHTENEPCFDIMSVNSGRVYKLNVGFGENKKMVY